MKILVRSPNWIGDQILAYPFFHYLREVYPQAHITVVCVPWVEAAQFKNLVDEVRVLPRVRSGKWMDRLKMLNDEAAAVKARGPWDLALLLPNSLSAAWFAYRAGAKVRRGYAVDARGLLLTDKVKWDPDLPRHRAQDYVGLLPGDFGDVLDFWGEEAENDLDPPIPGVLDIFPAEKAWPDAGAHTPPEEPYYVLAPGSAAESRRWPLQYFAELARQIHSETKLRGLIVGGPVEAPLASKLCDDRSLKLSDWTAQGSVASYWKIFRQARFTVSNDSGLAHVASLCGSPVQVVWGAGNPKKTEPIGPGKARILFQPIDCWPCERNTCALPPERNIECLKRIEPTEVWKEIKSGFRRSAN